MSSQLSPAERTKRLRAYLQQIAPDKQLHSAGIELQAATGGRSTGERLDVLTSSNRRSADDEGLVALDVLIQDENAELTPSGLDSLEAIVHKVGRPVFDIKNDVLVNPPSNGPWTSIGTGDCKRRLEAAIPSVGRIEIPNDIRPYAGTGFVVGEDLLMTNRHVARIFANGVGEKNLRFDPDQSAAIDFKREIPRRNDPDPVLLKVTNVIMIHPYWDMALLRVKGLPAESSPLRLNTTDPGELDGHSVAVIGYPARDGRNDIDLQLDIFDRVFEVKRLAPGKFNGRRDYELNGVSYGAVAHDSSTLGGNSGSGVIDLETGEVIALHFAGKYLVTNWAVSMFDLAQDTRVVDAGVNFSPNQRVEPNGNFYGPIWARADEDLHPASLPKGLQTVEEESDTRELFFSRGPSASDFVSRFSLASLALEQFDWNTALSAALASHLAYLSESSVHRICREVWKFADCSFFSVDDTECFVATTSEVALVAFRGTELRIRDWLTDLNAFSASRPYGRVHRGFLSGFRGVEAQLHGVLSKVPGRPVVLTGHSLGGALATIAAAEWFSDFPISSVYTFGQPGVGKGRFPSFMGEHFAANFHRFVNDDDIVALVPPTYKHVGRLLHFDSSGGLKEERSEAAMEVPSVGTNPTPVMSEAQFDRLRAQLLAARSTGFAGVDGEEGLIPSFGDHKLIRYIQRVAAKAS